MNWKIYQCDKPCTGQHCIVAYRPNINSKPIAGIFVYHYMNNGAYWLNKNNEKRFCQGIDNWCAVDDIIYTVERMIEDDIQSEMDKNNLINN